MHVQSPIVNQLKWTDGGVLLTGNPLVAENDPNTTPPTSSRIIQPQYSTTQVTYVIGNNQANMQALIVGGTSIVCTAWFYDNTLTTWIRFGVDITHTTAGNASVAENFNVPFIIVPGIQWFIQIKTVTGNVTSFGYIFN